MSFSLKEYNLKPDALYRVSLVLNQGDKEVDTLRSFYSKTPKFFTKNLSDFISYPLVSTGVITTAAKPGTVSGGTAVVLKIDKLSWKIKGSLTKLATPKYSFTLTLKKQGKGKAAKTVGFTGQQLKIQNPSSNPWMQRALQQMVQLGALSAKNGKITFTIDGATMGLTFSQTGSGFNTKYYWSSDGISRTSGGTVKPSKNFPSITYTSGVTTTSGTPAYAKTSKTLQASANTSIYQELVNNDNVKDIIFWLFSDSPEIAPNAINSTEANWKFLDFGFGNAIGRINGWDRATGQNIFNSSNGQYYLPTKDDLGDFPERNNGTIQNKIIFDNGNSAEKIEPSKTQAPVNFYVCFTIVRFTLKNNVWEPQWLVEEVNSDVPTPQISQIMSAGVA